MTKQRMRSPVREAFSYRRDTAYFIVIQWSIYDLVFHWITLEYRIVPNKRTPSNKRPLTYFQIKLGKRPKFLYGVSL